MPVRPSEWVHVDLPSIFVLVVIDLAPDSGTEFSVARRR